MLRSGRSRFKWGDSEGLQERRQSPLKVWISNLFTNRQSTRLQSLKKMARLRQMGFCEGELERRELLSTTSFSLGLQTINLDPTGEFLPLINAGSKISISFTVAISQRLIPVFWPKSPTSESRSNLASFDHLRTFLIFSKNFLKFSGQIPESVRFLYIRGNRSTP